MPRPLPPGVELRGLWKKRDTIMTRNATRTTLLTLIATLALLSACGSDGEPSSDGMAAGGTTELGTGGALSGTGAVSGVGGTTGGMATGGTATGGMTAGAGGTPTGGGGATGGSGAATGGSDAAGGAGSGGIDGSGGLSNAGTGGVDGSGGSPLAPVADYSDPGPYGTTTEGNTGPDGTYTIVRPETLGEDGFLHAPITFGPGIGMEVSQLSGLLERFASHGFVVIGKRLDGGPRDAENRARMTNGLDWLIEQNSATGSVFEGMIDTEHAIAMGYSVGGTAAVEVGGHQAIATVVSIHGHSAEGDLDGPMLLIGGTEDVMNDGMSWLAPTYEASQVQTFFGTVMGADHGYIQGTVDGVPGGVETPAMVAWIRYWIYGDQEAAIYFTGDDCVMCDSPWTNPQRKNWP